MNETLKLLETLARHYDYTVRIESSSKVLLIGNGGPVFEFDSLEEALSEFYELLKEDNLEDKPESWEEALSHIESL